MSQVALTPLTEDDLAFLAEVRNHPDTLRYLHHDKPFSLDQSLQWFRNYAPKWYLITHEGAKVGYVRTSDWDDQNKSVMIGADIHPLHRRRGYATAALAQFIKQLQADGWHRIWLEVLPNNHAAIRLYTKLGFKQEGVKRGAVLRDGTWLDSIQMSLLTDAPRSAKVIVVYLGYRRGNPRTPREAVALLRFLLDQDKTVDPGYAMDTLIVHNRFEPPQGDSEAASWLAEGEALLNQADGRGTPWGTIHVTARKNVGLSFGGYNHAFSLWGEQYDYFLFTEDDQIMVKPGYLATAVRQLEADNTIGFVALVGVSQDERIPPCAHGGVGVSPRHVLRRVKAANPCLTHPEGHLPYHLECGYRDQEMLGEVRFTNAIHQLGYKLVNIADEQVCMSWGDRGRRTPRMTPWRDRFDPAPRLTQPQNQRGI